MKTILVLAALTTCVSSAYAANTIPPSRARSSVGQLVIVEGKANIQDDASRAGTDVDVTGPNGHMIAFIPVGDKNQFPALDSFEGKTVDVTGVVDMESSGPEIRITTPNQLKLATP